MHRYVAYVHAFIKVKGKMRGSDDQRWMDESCEFEGTYWPLSGLMTRADRNTGRGPWAHSTYGKECRTRWHPYPLAGNPSGDPAERRRRSEERPARWSAPIPGRCGNGTPCDSRSRRCSRGQRERTRSAVAGEAYHRGHRGTGRNSCTLSRMGHTRASPVQLPSSRCVSLARPTPSGPRRSPVPLLSSMALSFWSDLWNLQGAL
jgi:hypothetical protein